MSKIKKSSSQSIQPVNKNNRNNVTLGEKLKKRAADYSEKSGLSIPALLRNGLDMLLKQNNF